MVITCIDLYYICHKCYYPDMTWQYIAGFFDGEGSLIHNGKGYRIVISQTHKQVLEEIKRFTRLGNVIEITKRKEHWKDAWVYYIAKQKDVLKFTQEVLPYLWVKKDAAESIQTELTSIVKKQDETIAKRIALAGKAKLLRQQGLTYRQIGSSLNKDFGQIRRLIINN